MHSKTGALLASALAIATVASQAQAQTQGAPIQSGPPISGICVLSTQGIVAQSTVGKFVQSRLTQLAQAAQAEITAAQSSLQSDEKAFEAQRASLSPEQANQRGSALVQRERDLENLVNARRQEMSATQQKAFARVLTEADPVVRQLYTQHNCSLLLDGQAVLITAPAMDLTGQVVTGLNAKITQFTFDRERVTQQSQ
jgi:Skp family chaperone for outer membrane proteins